MPEDPEEVVILLAVGQQLQQLVEVVQRVDGVQRKVTRMGTEAVTESRMKRKSPISMR